MLMEVCVVGSYGRHCVCKALERVGIVTCVVVVVAVVWVAVDVAWAVAQQAPLHM